MSCGQPSETGFTIQGGQGSNQVTICHHPPRNPNNVQSITVGESAVDAHLAHGDTLGACGTPTPSGSPPEATPTPNPFMNAICIYL